jgi:P pilus assembly chaperone PapD
MPAPGVMMKWKLHFAVVAAVILVLLFPVSALAGLRVGPTFIDQEVQIGENNLGPITVNNNTDTAMDLRVEIRGYGQSLFGVTQGLDNDTNPFTIASHVQASPTEFSLEPGQSRDVDVTVDVPEDSNGGKYATVFIYSVPPVAQSMSVSMAVAVGLRLAVMPSHLSRNGRIDSIIPGQIESAEPIGVAVIMRNTGNVHYSVKCRITVKDEAGATVFASGTVDSHPILPSYSQQLQFNWTPSTELPPATYSIEAEATLEDGTPVDSTSSTFVLTETYFPPGGGPNWGAVAGGIIGGMAAVGAAVYYLVFRRRRSMT